MARSSCKQQASSTDPYQSNDIGRPNKTFSRTVPKEEEKILCRVRRTKHVGRDRSQGTTVKERADVSPSFHPPDLAAARVPGRRIRRRQGSAPWQPLDCLRRNSIGDARFPKSDANRPTSKAAEPTSHSPPPQPLLTAMKSRKKNDF